MPASPWTHRIARSTALVALPVALLTACGTDPVTTVDDELTGTIALTRQRDLLDRGLVNVFVHNRGPDAIVLSDVSLDADLFDAPPVTDRATTVRAGREIAIQVPFGRAVDCATDQPVTARLRFGAASEPDSWPRAAVLPLGGTDVLDAIHAEQCATEILGDTVQITLDDVRAVDDVLTVDLVIEHTGGPPVEVAGVAGTILVGAAAPPASLGSRLVAGDTLAVPLTFRVNRCDPHAMAEVTKRFGVELGVSIDGAPPVDVAIDVSPIERELEQLVERCRVSALARETAVVTCDALRGLANRIVDLVNQSVAGVSSLAPAERRTAVLDGVASVEGELIAWRAAVDDVTLPDSAHDAVLVQWLRDGADAAMAEIDAQAASFRDGPAVVPDDEVQGLVGTWFTTIEKVMSELEPDVSRLGDAVFEQAFLDEPSCRHVVQQYVVD